MVSDGITPIRIWESDGTSRGTKIASEGIPPDSGEIINNVNGTILFAGLTDQGKSALIPHRRHPSLNPSSPAVSETVTGI